MKRILILLLASFLSAPALAHKLNAFAIAEGNTVSVEGYFSDGIPARNAIVVVTDADGNVVNEGQANEKGQYQFSGNVIPGLMIKINAGMGHVASYRLDGSVAGKNAMEQTPKGDSQKISGAASVDGDELRQVVSEAIKPLAREISELKQKSRMSDIVGGIGYILGILGLFAYLKYRKESQRS